MTLMDERDEVNTDISEVFKEAGDSGFVTKDLRKVIAKKRAMLKDAAAYRASEEMQTLYWATLYQPDLPFEPLNPGLAENRKKTELKVVVPDTEVQEPGAPTTDEAEFV